MTTDITNKHIEYLDAARRRVLATLSLAESHARSAVLESVNSPHDMMDTWEHLRELERQAESIMEKASDMREMLREYIDDAYSIESMSEYDEDIPV